MPLPGQFRKPQVLESGDILANGKIGLLEHHIQSWGKTGKVWQDRIIERIKTTLEARITKEREKRVKRITGYDNDKYVLRTEFESDLQLDESEAAGGLADIGRRYGQREQQ